MRNKLSAISYQLSNAGFTLVELLISIVIFLLAIAAASQMFTGLLTQFKQQSKIAETNIEGIVGLEILRQDIEHAGYGLPWNIPSDVTYSEASSSPASGFNEPTTGNTTDPPRAILSGDNIGTNGSDYLVIKAVNVAPNNSSVKWTELIYSTSACSSPFFSSLATNVCKRSWTPSTENLSSSDLVGVINPVSPISRRILMANTGAYTATALDGIDSSWLPTSETDNIRLVYGLRADGNAPMRPFNRADYYISTSNVPRRCASHTGVLEKATMDYNGGFNHLPLLDCVADMQVTYCLDTNGDGTPDSNSDDISGLDAQQIRDQLKEVRVYIVTHEGQKDMNYDFSLGGSREYLSLQLEVCGTSSHGPITFVNLKTLIGNTEYKYYRWKLYTIVVKPMDLQQ